MRLSHEVEQLLQHGLASLNDREREVLSGRYGLSDREPETLDVLAIRLKLTRERIRQIQIEALAKLKRNMEDRSRLMTVASVAIVKKTAAVPTKAVITREVPFLKPSTWSSSR